MKTLMTFFTGIMLIGCTGADHQAMFASEKTLNTLTNAAFQNAEKFRSSDGSHIPAVTDGPSANVSANARS
jgi:hypothetical protein